MNCSHTPGPVGGRNMGMDQDLTQAIILINGLVTVAGGLPFGPGFEARGHPSRWLPFQGYGRAVH
jgi:hypothetical protein